MKLVAIPTREGTVSVNPTQVSTLDSTSRQGVSVTLVDGRTFWVEPTMGQSVYGLLDQLTKQVNEALMES